MFSTISSSPRFGPGEGGEDAGPVGGVAIQDIQAPPY